MSKKAEVCWGRFMWFGNLAILAKGPTFTERFEAFSKITVSALAVAFVAAAFSDVDVLSQLPEKVTVAIGGLIGFIVGAFKFV